MFPGKYFILFLLLIFISPCSLFTPSSAANSGDEILYDISPFVRVYKNGTVQRFFGQDFLPASTDPSTGVRSKDVSIAKDLGISARIYLPENVHPGHKIPLLIYFHGGGFFSDSAFSSTYHPYMNSLVAKANIVAVSVNYRLAPEHPLPIAYQDSWLALNWAFRHSSGNGVEPWLTEYADFGRVFLGGDSAGANIANRMAIRVGLEGSDPGVEVKGMFLNCPFFWGKRLIGNESGDVSGRNSIEAIWLHAYPNSTGLDDPLVNPGMDPDLGMLGCKRVLVYVGGEDVLRSRGWYYMEVLKKSGWNGVVKVVEVEGEGHAFNLEDPTTPKAIAMLKAFALFLNNRLNNRWNFKGIKLRQLLTECRKACMVMFSWVKFCSLFHCLPIVSRLV